MDTIAAISTAPGRGAIAVVRLTGPESVEVVDRLFLGKEALATTRSHSVRHGKLNDRSGQRLDDVLVTVMRAPDTYTGEDVVEISCHGGTLVSQLVLQALLGEGCRLAEPGEFTKRAFINGRIDLAQAEAVAELIAARTKRAVERALTQLEGGLSERIRAVRVFIVEVLADLEARIDFPEDVTDNIKVAGSSDKLTECARLLEAIISERTVSTLLSAGARIPIVGRPNVGKSSLFNAIVGRPRVMVSPRPGTTRDTVEEEIELDGVPVRFVDTAGLRTASEELEEEGVRRTLDELRLADFVILVVDASAGAAAPVDVETGVFAEQAYSDDLDAIESIGKKPCLIVINKVDIASSSVARSAFESRGRRTSLHAAHATRLPDAPFPTSGCGTFCDAAGSGIVETSAFTGTGIDSLRRVLASRVTEVGEGLQDASCASQRHIKCLRSALENVQNARRELVSGTPEELVAFELREAAQELGLITGERVGPDILDSIFSRFCVGK